MGSKVDVAAVDVDILSGVESGLTFLAIIVIVAKESPWIVIFAGIWGERITKGKVGSLFSSRTRIYKSTNPHDRNKGQD